MSNRRRHDLEIKPDQLTGVNEKFGETLNERFKRISEALESASGLRGPVSIAKQKKKGAIATRESILNPGMVVEDNRIALVADPIDEQDAINLRTLKKILAEHNPDQGDAVSDLIDDEDDGPSASPVTLPYFYGVMVKAIPDIYLSGGLGAGNVLRLWEFYLPFATIVSSVTYYNNTGGAGTGGVGLYDSNKNLVVDSGPVDQTTVGVKTTTITPVSVPAGVYYLAHTSTTGGTLIQFAVGTGYHTFSISSGHVRIGSGGATSLGVLPGSFSTITAVVAFGVPVVFFQ